MARPLRATCALALAAVLACLPVALSWAQERPENGVIAFAGQHSGERVIYTRKSNGTGLRLVRIGGGADDPAFSARGKRVVFTRRTSSGKQLWVSYLDGQGQRQLTPGPSDGMAQWSPDAGQVVFARGRRGRRDVYRLLADGTGLRRLTFSAHDDHSPVWSATDQIAFVRGSGNRSRVYLVASAGGAARRLTHRKAPETTPAWSPTGRTVVISRGRAGKRDLYLVRRDGSHARPLTAVRGDEIEPAFSPDGTRVVFTHRRGGKRRIFLMKVRGRPIKRLVRRSARVRRITTSRSRAAQPTWQPAGLSPVVAAVGDIACDPAGPYFNGGEGISGFCRQKLTSNLLLRADLTYVLPLGDNQYEAGTLANFQRSYDLSWGRMKFMTKPIPGNHEYRDPDAAGYYDYFNGAGQQVGAAGDRDAGYYSFDVGSWHVIALNSECRHIGGCGANSPQMTWLRNDLAAHSSSSCTMALWHRPHFTSGGHDDKADMLPAWNLLYANNADLILNGHDHFYERFAPQTPAGAVDLARGIREFVVGMGGRSRFGLVDPQPNSEEATNSFYGVLQLTLRDGAYEWKAVRVPTGGAVDEGRANCH